MEDCIVYLVWQLRQSGFEIRFTWPNLLYISWKHHEGAYLAHKNPIVQAMTPEVTPPPAPMKSAFAGGSQKKKGGQAQVPNRSVAFNDEIDLLTRGSSASPLANGPLANGPLANGPLANSQMQQRRAMDYEPPASFIQNLDRPGPGREQKGGVIKGNVLADLWTI